MYNKINPPNRSQLQKLNDFLAEVLCSYDKCPNKSNFDEIFERYQKRHEIGTFLFVKFLELLTDELYNKKDPMDSIEWLEKVLQGAQEKSVMITNKKYNSAGEKHRTEFADEIIEVKKKIFRSGESFAVQFKEFYLKQNNKMIGTQFIQRFFEGEPNLRLHIFWGKYWGESDCIIENENDFLIWDFEFQERELLEPTQIPLIRAHILGWLYEKSTGKSCSGLKISYFGTPPIKIEYNEQFIEKIDKN